MKSQNTLKKLSRIELVELIYDLRRENLALEERCQELEARVQEMEAEPPHGELWEKLEGIEDMLQKIRSSQVSAARRRVAKEMEDSWYE